MTIYTLTALSYESHGVMVTNLKERTWGYATSFKQATTMMQKSADMMREMRAA